jgi:hypothetical protein
MFRKERVMKATKDDPVSTAELRRDDWKALSKEEKTEYEYLAESQKQSAANLTLEIQASGAFADSRINHLVGNRQSAMGR